MGRRLLLVSLALSGVLLPAIASAQVDGGYGDYTAWANWARVIPGERAAVASSWDRSGGNLDHNHYESPPGWLSGNVTTVAATLHGPGIIYRYWMPHIEANLRFAVRMYFDGESTPRINSDSQQILGGTFGYFAAPLVTTFAGGQVCYEPIPFRDSLRIQTQNKSGKNHYYQYSVRLFPPGTAMTSYTGTLSAAAQSARLATVAMFQSVGQHPAGASSTSLEDGVQNVFVPAAGSVTVAHLTGPGLIRRLNVRMVGATDADLDNLHLRITYDHDSEPAVDVPVGWFFGAGHGRAPYKSLPLGTDSPDGFYSYWPMPFRDDVFVELFNTSAAPIFVDAAEAEHESQSVAGNAGYLHATAKSVTRTPADSRAVLVTATGTGQYVGNLLYVRQDATSFNFMQGDDIVVADSDTLHGTGLEDAYNGGHYYNWSSPVSGEPEGAMPAFAARPLHGILDVELESSPHLARSDQYRWMIGDHIPFRNSLEVSVETQYASVGSQWTSVAFWYRLPTGLLAAPLAAEVRGHLKLEAISPNPLTSTATIDFSLPTDAGVTVELVDVTGRRVRTIVEGRLNAGPHRTRMTRDHLASGVYFLRVQAGDQVAVRKVVIAN